MNLILSGLFDDFYDNVQLANTHAHEYCFCGVQGAFPYCYFNGGVNNIERGEICLYRDMIECLRGYGSLASMVIIDFGNLLLEKKDYHNNFAKIHFETFAADKRFWFQMSDPIFIEYVVSKYPNIQIILHQNFTFFHSEEEIKELVEKYENIKGIVIKHGQLCSDIKATKFYLLECYNCLDCKSQLNCIKYDNQESLEYSISSCFYNCKRRAFIETPTMIEYLQEGEKNADFIIIGQPKVDNSIHFDFINNMLMEAKKHD